MNKTKITSLKSSSRYHISGCTVKIEWKVQNYFFVILRIGNKFRFFHKKNHISLFLYNSQNVKLYAFGDFSFDKKKLSILVRKPNKIKNNYKLLKKPIRLNDTISSVLLRDNNVSIANINFNIKEIKLNKTL